MEEKLIRADSLLEQIKSPYTEYPVMIGIRKAIKDMINEAEIVEAIPIEWIRKWARKMVAETDNFNWGVYTLIMLEDWETENAKVD